MTSLGIMDSTFHGAGCRTLTPYPLRVPVVTAPTGSTISHHLPSRVSSACCRPVHHDHLLKRYIPDLSKCQSQSSEETCSITDFFGREGERDRLLERGASGSWWDSRTSLGVGGVGMGPSSFRRDGISGGRGGTGQGAHIVIFPSESLRDAVKEMTNLLFWLTKSTS